MQISEGRTTLLKIDECPLKLVRFFEDFTDFLGSVSVTSFHGKHVSNEPVSEIQMSSFGRL